MASVRLPLQLGRAALNQGARFAATVWLFPLLLILAAMLLGVTTLGVMVFGIAAFAALAITVDAADTAKRDRPCDIVLDEAGFTIEGGPLDKTHCKWSEVHPAECKIVKAEPRRAIRWLVLGWLTGNKIAAITSRARVTVHHLQLPRGAKDLLVLAEAEGEELESLTQLRDSIVGAATPPHGAPAELPQEILKCPHCGAPQVPAATATMTCTACGHELAVPLELQERMRASVELEGSSGARASVVRKLVDQPSARHAAWVIAWCRRMMVWIQPVAFGWFIALLVHQTSWVTSAGTLGIVRDSPSDDGVGLYDLCLLALCVAAAFGIAWSIGHAYVANRQALRVLADNFGAVPPIKPGAPSTCRQCGAPLPTTNALLVHCVYCSAENVLGIDPRPAALRHKRERIDLGRGLRVRRRARIRLAILIPVSVLVAVALIREVRIAWHVPFHGSGDGVEWGCGHCGMITNKDPIRRVITFDDGNEHEVITVLPHAAVSFTCGACSLELGGARLTPSETAVTNLHIEHGAFHPVH